MYMNIFCCVCRHTSDSEVNFRKIVDDDDKEAYVKQGMFYPFMLNRLFKSIRI